jgi:MSHA biogenesis protein MshG
MPNYYYQAKDYSGNPSDGVLEANDEAHVAKQLAAKNLVPISIALETSEVSMTAFLDKLLLRGRVNIDAMVMFCRQMSVLIRAGVPLISALQRIQETTESEPLAEALQGVIEKITGGQSLTVALQQYPRAFPAVVSSIVDAGENSGRLDLAFVQLADYFQLESVTKKRIKAATRYPKIVIAAIVVAISVINFMVIPAFAKMFASFNVELPLPTRILMASSNFFLAYGTYIFMGLVICFFILRLYLQTPAGILIADQIKTKLPIVGELLQRIILGRFCRTFAMILKSGVPLVQGITLSANAMGNVYMANKVLSMRDNISRGETMSRAAYETQLFTPLVLQMLLVGEDTGQIDEMLLHVAEFYEEEVDYDLGQLSTLLEPIILVILGVMVLILALGIFLPMWNMSQFVKH